MLRQRVTTDIATKGGQFDVLTIGTYEVPIWAKQGWLVPLENLGADYDVDDLLPAIRAGSHLRGQALRRALLRRELDDHVSQGPVREGRHHDAGQPDLGVRRRRGAQAHRQERRDLRHLPARQGRLGREHGLPHRHVELLRRALVRRELEAAVRPAGLEGDARLLRQAGERRRPSGRLVERLQREPRALQLRQVRHVDRRHGRRLLRHQPEGILGRRQGRLRARAEYRQGQERQLAVGLVARHSRRLAEGRGRRKVHRLGDLEGLHRPRRVEGRLGERSSGHAQVALRQPGVPDGRALRRR